MILKRSGLIIVVSIILSYVIYHTHKSSQIDSISIDVISSLKIVAEVKKYDSLLKAITDVSKDNRITYFEYDSLLDLYKQIELKNITTSK